MVLPLAEIVLIQDDPVEAAFALEFLAVQRLLNQVTVLGDGQVAADYLRGVGRSDPGVAPQLVLLHLRLPKVDGFELISMIRGEPLLAHVVVAVLGRPELEGEMLRGRGLRVDAIIDPPVTLQDILELARIAPNLQTVFVRRVRREDGR